MTERSLLWYALGEVGRKHGGTRADAASTLALTVREATTDLNEIHDNESLLLRAVTHWNDGCGGDSFDPVLEARAISKPACALLARGVCFWNESIYSKQMIMFNVLNQGMWEVLDAFMRQPGRPDWESVFELSVYAHGVVGSFWDSLQNYPNAMPVLVNAGLPANYKRPDGKTLLFLSGNLSAARWCVSQGADPSAQDCDGTTAAVYHQRHLPADQQDGWFDLCGRALSPAHIMNLAMAGNKAKFVAAVKKPGAFRWEMHPGVIVNALDGAIVAALPSDRLKEPSPVLFRHLLNVVPHWPEPSMTMAKLTWLATVPEKHSNGLERIQDRLNLDVEGLAQALPDWLSYIHRMDDQINVAPYAAWFDYSANPIWRAAVIEAQLDQLNNDPECWLECTTAGCPGILSTLSMRPKFAIKNLPDEWNSLTPTHQFALAAWTVASEFTIHPDYQPQSSHSAQYQAKTASTGQDVVRYGLSIMRQLVNEGKVSLNDVRWQALWSAGGELTGYPFHQLQADHRQAGLDRIPARASRPRPRG